MSSHAAQDRLAADIEKLAQRLNHAAMIEARDDFDVLAASVMTIGLLGTQAHAADPGLTRDEIDRAAVDLADSITDDAEDGLFTKRRSRPIPRSPFNMDPDKIGRAEDVTRAGLRAFALAMRAPLSPFQRYAAAGRFGYLAFKRVTTEHPAVDQDELGRRVDRVLARIAAIVEAV